MAAEQGSEQGPGYIFTGVFTAMVKVFGLLIAVAECFVIIGLGRPAESQVLALAAFMMAGAQFADGVRDWVAKKGNGNGR